MAGIARRWPLALVVLAVLAAGLFGAKGVAADPTGLSVTSYNVFTNRLALSWTDAETYTGCTSLSSTGWYVRHAASSADLTGAGVRLGSPGNCGARSGAISSLDFGDGGVVRYFQVMVRSNNGGVHSPWSTAVSYTLPARVDVTAATYDAANDELDLTWTAPTLTGSVNWYYYLAHGDDPADLDDAHHGQLGTGTGLTSATIDDPPLTLGQTLYVWVMATTSTLSSDGAFDSANNLYLAMAWSNPHSFTPLSSLTGCTASDLAGLGGLYGYGYDISGDLSDAACTVDSGVTGFGDTDAVGANVYSFEMSAQRSTSFTFTPVTSFGTGTPDGEYKLRVRSGSLSGDVVGEANGEGALTLSSLALGSGIAYVIEVMRYGVGGGQEWSLSLSYGFIQAPTPTPMPTPTPRVQLNLDFRLHPNPGGIAYTAGTVYSLEPEGGAGFFPVTVRSANPAALELSLVSTITCDVTAEDEVEVDSQGDTLYVKACTAGHNTTLTVISDGGDLLAQYSVFVRGGPVPTPGPAAVSQGVGADVSKRDELGFGIILGVVCGGFGVGCDTDLITILVVIVGAVIVMAFLLRRSRGAATSMSVGVAATFALLVLMLGYLWLGFPLWLVVVVLIPVLAVGGIAAVVRFRQVG